MIKLKRFVIVLRAYLKSLAVVFCPHKVKTGKPEHILFLIGCGRSGTTFLTRAIGKDNRVAFLDERREIWNYFFPELNIWSNKNAVLGTDLNLYFKEDKVVGLQRFMEKIRKCKGALFVLEKLPINSFRIEFLKNAFGESRFIYIERCGMDVASSIAKKVPSGWWGKNNLKWVLLEKYVRSEPDLCHLIDVLRNEVDKGLLEWRVSVQLARQNLNFEDKSVFFVEYETLVRDYQVEMTKLYNYIGLDTTNMDWSMETLKNNTVREVRTDATHELIGGAMLVSQLTGLEKRGFIRWTRTEVVV